MHWNEWSYPPIVEYTSQYVTVLIFLHYFAIVLAYLKSKEEIYLLEVSRQCRLGPGRLAVRIRSKSSNLIGRRPNRYFAVVGRPRRGP